MSPSSFAIGLGSKEAPGHLTSHVVSFWHLPGGYDVVNARAIEFFFDDVDDAALFEKKFKAPPEMAFMSAYQENR